MDKAQQRAVKSIDYPVLCIAVPDYDTSALETFFATLSPRVMETSAIVCIQQRSSDHLSSLKDILIQQLPELIIEDIRTGMDLQPARLYINDPHQTVVLQQGIFRCDTNTFNKEHRYTIDRLFCSCAYECSEWGIGILFSSSDTDGILGLQTIKNKGGLAFALDLNNMQRDTIQYHDRCTSMIDYSITPDALATRINNFIINYKNSEKSILSGSGISVGEKEYQAVLHLLCEKSGYDFFCYKKHQVLRHILRRLHLHEVDSFQEYIELLRQQHSEISLLLDEILVGATGFFRDPDSWKMVEEKMVHPLVARVQEQKPIRIWVPGCSTGEEAYSIAMMVLMAGREQNKTVTVQIFATDINENALQTARAGIYPVEAVAGVASRYVHAFFIQKNDGLSVRIKKNVRDTIVFAKQDIMTDPPFSRLDLVICRNVLTYLDSPAQEKVCATFHFALKDKAYLFLGSTESPVCSTGDRFRLIDTTGDRGLYQHTAAQAYKGVQNAYVYTPRSQRCSFPAPAEPVSNGSDHQIASIAQSLLLENYAPAGAVIDRTGKIFYRHSDISRYLGSDCDRFADNLLQSMLPRLRYKLRNTINKVLDSGMPANIHTMGICGNGEEIPLVITVYVIHDYYAEELLLVIFEELDTLCSTIPIHPIEKTDSEFSDECSVQKLQKELAAAHKAHQATIEQLQSLNEELYSSNEELRITNEELEESRQELQSLNEELQVANQTLKQSHKEMKFLNDKLVSVNVQLEDKIAEIKEANDDLRNFFTSTEIPTLFLDAQMRIKCFTPALTALVEIDAADKGKYLRNIPHEHIDPDLCTDAPEVITSKVPTTRQIQSGNQQWFIRRILPYYTADKCIEGVVVTFTDITSYKKAEIALLQERAVAEQRAQEAEEGKRVLDALMEYIPEGIIIADASTKTVRMVSRRGYELAAQKPEIFKPVSFEDYSEKFKLYHMDGSTLVDLEAMPLIRATLNGEEVKSEEYVLKRPDGSAIIVSINAGPIRNQQGLVIAGVITCRDITQRKKREEELLRLATILETTSDFIITTRPDGTILYFNKAIRKLLNIDTDADLSRYSIPAIHPQWAASRIETAGYPAAKLQGIWYGETAIRNAQGKEIPTSQVIIAHQSPHGELLYYSTIARDISIEKQASLEREKLLEENRTQRQFLEKLIENAPVGIAVVKGSEYRYELANPYYRTIPGTPNVSLIGHTIKELIPLPIKNSGVSALDESWRSRKSIKIREHELKTDDEESAASIWNIDFVPLLSSNNDEERILILATDVSEQVHIRKKLEFETARYQAILESMNEGLVIIGADGNLLGMNPAALLMHGYTYEEEGKRHLSEYPAAFKLFDMKEREISLPNWPLTRALHGERFTGYEAKICRVDTGKVWYGNYNGTPVYDRHGHFIMAIVTVRDVTELKLGEKTVQEAHDLAKHRASELLAANKELESFAYSVSHDLSAPLRTIDGFCQLLFNNYSDAIDQKGQSYMHRIRQGVTRMRQLIEDILYLSRITQKEMVVVEVDMAGIAQEIITGLQKEYPNRRVDCVIQKDMKTMGDPRLLKLALYNLLSNAWKFTEKTNNAKIEFGLTPEEDNHIFYIKDNGAGFDMQYAKRLFLPFQRLHLKNEFSGNGVGLAIVDRVIRKHCGKIWTEAAVNEGATFYFTLAVNGKQVK